MIYDFTINNSLNKWLNNYVNSDISKQKSYLTRIVWSSDEVRNKDPSGENVTQWTQLVCPLQYATFDKDLIFHNYIKNIKEKLTWI